MSAIESHASSTEPWPRSGPASRSASRGTSIERSPRVAQPRWPRGARWGLAIVFLLFAYEWLLSGVDKVLSADFRPGLADNLREAMKDNPNHWYVHWLNNSIVPHASLVALLVEIGELLVALGFILGAYFWLRGDRLSPGWRNTLQVIVLITLLGSAFMTANYYFLMGETYPWVNSGDPFDEGLSIDGLLTLISLALLVFQLIVWRQFQKPTEGTAASS